MPLSVLMYPANGLMEFQNPNRLAFSNRSLIAKAIALDFFLGNIMQDFVTVSCSSQIEFSNAKISNIGNDFQTLLIGFL
jgi:hypothetical protein